MAFYEENMDFSPDPSELGLLDSPDGSPPYLLSVRESSLQVHREEV
jgi:hypothetical protein